MAPGERRRAATRAAQLIAVLAFLIALVAVLRGGRSDAPVLGADQGADQPADSGAGYRAARQPAAGNAVLVPGPGRPAASGRDELAAQPAAQGSNSIDARLEREVRAAISASIAEASRRQPKKVSPATVTVAVHVRQLGVPGELLAIEADRSLRPASNMKLVTAATALVSLGPEGQFETLVEATGPIDGEGLLRGDLVLRAGADPLYVADARGAVEQRLEPLMVALANRGLRRIEGRLVLDEGSYPDPAPGPAWPSPDQHWEDYCALAGGFSANAGCLTASVRSRGPGQAALVTIEPRGHGLQERFEVETVGRGQALRIAVGVRRNRVFVRGTIPADVTLWSERFSHPEPVELFGNVLKSALEESGIQLAGGVVRERGCASGRLLEILRSPLIEMLGPINTESDNGVADQVFLAVGERVTGAGTREGGRRATAMALERLGVGEQGLIQVDGSGLSRDNRVTARQVTALVDAVLRAGGSTAESFLGSLAVAGETGTLDDRMQGSLARGRVRAKTGWISGVSSLSGVAESLEGRRWIFSILVAYPRVSGLNSACWKPMQNSICELLVTYDG